jgi:PAS domain S-box-containing protein
MNMALAHAMPGISRLTPDGRYQTVNETYAKALGYTPDELVGTDWERTVHPDDKARALAAYETMVRDGKGEFEAVAVRNDGTTFWKHVLMVKVVDDHGGHIGHHCFMRDITERKQAEEALRISEQSIRELYSVASMPEAALDDRVEQLLRLGCRRFSCSIGLITRVRGEQLEVAHVWAPGGSIQQGDLLKLQQTYCSVTIGSDEPVRFEHAEASEWHAHQAYAALGFECYLGTKLVGTDRLYGTICFLDAQPRSTPFTEADIDFLQLMARWLSGEFDRQSALTALHESERRYRTLYDETPSMYFTVDEDGIVHSVNDYGAQYLGYRAGALVGR